jgi:hypothetical protein
MRARAETLGGTLEAAPTPDGGFLVAAVLPTPVAPNAHPVSDAEPVSDAHSVSDAGPASDAEPASHAEPAPSPQPASVEENR